MRGRRRAILRTTGLAVLAVAVAGCGSSAQQATGGGSGGNALERLKESGTVRVGWAEFAPYMHRDPKSNTVVGACMDLMQDVASSMDADTKPVEDSWPTILVGLNSGKYDMTLLGVTDERKKQSDFSDPLFQTDFTLVVKFDTGFQTLEDVDKPGNTISVTTGSNTDSVLSAAVKNAKILRVRDVGGALLAVKSGTANAMATTRDYMAEAVKKDSSLRLMDSRFGVSPFAIAVAKGQPELLAYVNEQVKQLKESGRVKAVLDDYDFVGVEVSPV